jgi:protein involved in polysaccharide export with SLBB domain
LAGGYTDAAYLKQVEIRRISLSQAQQAEVEILNISLANEVDSSFKLIGRDTLRINTIPNWTTEETIELSGEFVFPGTYTIYEGETISSLIERAGGFTNQAFLSGAQYYSATARESQTQQLKKISASVQRRLASRRSVGELDGSDQSNVIEGVLDQELLGRVVIDLQGILGGNQTVATLVEDGDTLFVPKYSNTISVIGEVYEPGTFKFEEGLTLQQYIEIAGGTTNYALKKNSYLLKADGSVRFYRSKGLKNVLSFNAGTRNGIEAGDAIVIPTNLDYAPALSRVSSITSVVFQSLTSIAAFLSITKQ